MQEKDLNGIIRKSFAEQGDFAFKIQDSGQYFDGVVSHQRNPYDGFAYYKGKFIAWESKFLPKPMVLNLQRLEDHQLVALQKTRKYLDSSIALFIVGIKWSTRETRVYVFTDLDEIEKRRTNKENILKKEWGLLTNYVKVSKGQIDLNKLLGDYL